MQVVPPDLGEHSFWGRFGSYLVGVLTLIVWRVWDYFNGEVREMRAEMKKVAETLATKADRDSFEKVASKDELDRQRDNVAKLFEAQVDIRKELTDGFLAVNKSIAESHAALLKAIHDTSSENRAGPRQ